MTPPTNEREAVVAWLRAEIVAIEKTAAQYAKFRQYNHAAHGMERAQTCRLVAEAIERGEHLKGQFA